MNTVVGLFRFVYAVPSTCHNVVPMIASTPSASVRRCGVELVIASFVVLLQELTLIRWVSAQVRVLAYFPNVVLISAFLGLGIGALQARRRSLLWLWPVSLLVLVITTIGMSRIAFTNRSVTEHLWLLYYDIPKPIVINDIRPPIILTFLLSGLSFIPLGQLVSERLRRFGEIRRSLKGYEFDLVGSLFGIAAFAALSFLRTFPVFWFFVLMTAGFYFFVSRGWRWTIPYLCASGLMITLIAGSERAQFYSPYYALRTVKSPAGLGWNILANGSLHQYAAALLPQDKLITSYDVTIRSGYPLPYQALAKKPERVLVLGAGTGNDVAVALEAGATTIDAIEIDPVILELGKKFHPDHPYSSSRVRLINDDARAFLNDADAKYDLIVFGTLDSMTRLSAFSEVRLDNFVYTTDCLREAKRHLTPDGGIAMYFMVGNYSIHQKLFAILDEVFGKPPLYLRKHYKLFNEIFLAGPAYDHLRRNDSSPSAFHPQSIDVPSDDWPYLYLEQREIPVFYLTLILVFLITAVIALRITAPAIFRARQFSGEMFLFGFGFLLLETKSITGMNLAWGATWLTNALVFGAILFMILIGTILMDLRPISWKIAATGLVVSLVVVYFVPSSVLLRRNWEVRLLLSTVFVGLPIFFASICFALRFHLHPSSDIAFGWNLLGAVFGGFVEFFSMAIGIRALTLVALAGYLMVLLTVERERSVGAVGG